MILETYLDASKHYLNRPGLRKNLGFSLYGSSVPLAFFLGVFIAGLTGQFLRFGWYFWIGTILLLTTVIVVYLTVPLDIQEHKEIGTHLSALSSKIRYNYYTREV